MPPEQENPAFEPFDVSDAGGRLVYAVGDVHGRSDLLARLLGRIQSDVSARDCPNPLVIFIGDYVDRGPDSAGVISSLAAQHPLGYEMRFLMGNHEQAMLMFLQDPIANRGWLAHGGLETMSSYGVSPLPSIGSGAASIVDAAEKLRSNLPRTHLDFLRGLERYIAFGPYLFVHAGVDCGVPLERQKDEDLLWAREKFLNDKRRYSHVVVHGHTPEQEPYHDQRRIGLDIGAYATGRLCAARFDGKAVEFLIEDGKG